MKVTIAAIMFCLLLSSSAAAGVRGKIHVQATVAEIHTLDEDPVGASVGDETSEFLRLWNLKESSLPIGHSFLLCTTLGRNGLYGSGRSSCVGTFAFPRGKITVQGVVRSLRNYTLVVTGGSALYVNVGGVLTVNSSGSKLNVVFNLR